MARDPASSAEPPDRDETRAATAISAAARLPAERLTVGLLAAALFLWMFATLLFGGQVFAFRDAAHFYYPLFDYCRQEWGAGRVPLWNPYENLGQPLAADGVSSVFYPGKLLFALPLPFAALYDAYILLHVVLAAWAAYRLARHYGASVPAAGLCGLAYAFGGSVLLNVYNIVFLVGAAWLPLALLAADGMLARRSPRWAVGFGVVLALMVLGGDPQMAYNAGLLAAVQAVWLWRRERRSTAATTTPGVRWFQWWRKRGTDTSTSPHPRPLSRTRARGVAARRPLLLGMAAVIALLLCAVQVLPSVEFVRRSTRADTPWGDRFWGRLPADSHLEEAYQFSVGPWRLAELFWPTVVGRQFPIHRRWLSALPGEGRIWTPSLYLGLIPLLLALSTWWKGRRTTGPEAPLIPGVPLLACPAVTAAATDHAHAGRITDAAAVSSDLTNHTDRGPFWRGVVVVAVLGSLGWYGLGWIAQEMLAAMHLPAETVPVGPPAGGVYWLMNLVLPGYAQFRYPAKLLVVAALGLGVLAAQGFDRQWARPSRGLRIAVLVLGALSLLGIGSMIALRSLWTAWLQNAKPDMVFGPLDVAGAWRDVLLAFGQTAVVCGAFWWLLRPRGPHARKPAEDPGHTRTAQEQLQLRAALTPGPSPATGEGRQTGIAAPWRWAVAVLLLTVVDLALGNGWMMVGAPAELWQKPSQFAAVLERLADDKSLPLRIDESDTGVRSDWRQCGSPDRLAEVIAWQRDALTPEHQLAARIALSDVAGTLLIADYDKFLASDSPDAPSQYMVESAAPPGGRTPARDLGGGAPVATVDGLAIWRYELFPGRAWTIDDQFVRRPCRIRYYDPLCVVVEAELPARGELVLADQFFPGWAAEITSGDGATAAAAIEPHQGALRSVALPPGRHTVTFRYRPLSFFCGAAVSTVAWLGLAVAVAWALARRRRGARLSPG